MADISQSAWDSTDNNNNQAAPNGFPEGMPPSGVNDGARAVMGGIKRFWNRVNGTQVTTGGPTAFSISYSITPSALVAGEIYSMKFHTAVANSPTLVIKGYAAKLLYKPTQSGVVTVSASDILGGMRVITQYDSDLDGLIVLGGLPVGGATPAAEYLVRSAAASLTNARVLQAGAGITLSASAGVLNVNVNYNETATYSKQQTFACLSLSDSTTISWDLNLGQVAAVTLGGNRALVVTGQKNGGCYVLRVTSGGTSSLSFGSSFKHPGGTAPTFTQSAGAVDILNATSDGTSLFVTVTKEFR